MLVLLGVRTFELFFDLLLSGDLLSFCLTSFFILAWLDWFFDFLNYCLIRLSDLLVDSLCDQLVFKLLSLESELLHASEFASDPPFLNPLFVLEE